MGGQVAAGLRPCPPRAGREEDGQRHASWEAFRLVDADSRSIVEPGDFEVLVGPSSRDKDLLKVTLRAE
jgi:beta-glucosidase